MFTLWLMAFLVAIFSARLQISVAKAVIFLLMFFRIEIVTQPEPVPISAIVFRVGLVLSRVIVSSTSNSVSGRGTST